MLLGLLFSGWILAADFERGRQLYQGCVSCHGSRGQGGRAKKTPKIAGQADWYLVSALRAFKRQERREASMLPYVKKLGEKDMEDLAAYISRLEPL